MNQEKLAKLNESFANLGILEEKRRILLAQLHMWHQVMLQGVDPDEVVGFGFSQEYAKPEPFGKESWRFGKKEDKDWYNFVRLKDGTKKRLEPPVRPSPKIPAVPSEV